MTRSPERDMFAAVFRASPNALVIAQVATGRIIDVNDAWTRLWGYSREESLGRTVVDLGLYASAEDREHAAAHLNETGQLDRLELCLRRKSGEIRAATLSMATVPWEGEPLVLTAIGDITQRAQTDKLLRESEERLKVLMDRNPSLIFMKDEEGRYVYLNPAYEKTFVRSKDWLGKTDFDFWPRESAELFRENDANVLASGQVHQFLEDSTFEGKRFCWLCYKFPFTGSDGRRFIGGIGIDVTERKQAEEALQKSEERFKLSMDATHDGLWDWNVITDEVYYSPSYYRILGYAPDEFAATLGAWKERVHPEDFERTVRINLDCIEGRSEIFTLEYRMQAKDGQWRWILSRGKCIARDAQGRGTRLIGTHVDVTERKQAEEVVRRDKEAFEDLVKVRTAELVQTQMELERAKRLSDIGTLAATVAHELRNPVAAIGMAAHNIRQKAAGLALDKHLATVDKKVAESDQIINNLLFYSRLRPPHFEKVEILAVLEEAADSTESRSRKAVSLVRNTEGLKGVIMEADPLQMREVFVNVLNNAHDAVSADRGEIRISAKVNKNDVVLRFEDNGPGVPGDIADKVFDPFFTTKAKGTGLGLSVCQQIVGMHEGEIGLGNKLGQGACIVVRLPLRRSRGLKTNTHH